MSEQILFVYGTLRRDTNGQMHHLLARYADFVGEATFQGKLYMVDYYPGIVPSEDTDDLVLGEVYRLHNPSYMLSRLDQYEECGRAFPEPTEYVRRMERVRLHDGRIITAWVYVYNRPTNNLYLIESGDFLQIEKAEKNSHI